MWRHYSTYRSTLDSCSLPSSGSRDGPYTSVMGPKYVPGAEYVETNKEKVSRRGGRKKTKDEPNEPGPSVYPASLSPCVELDLLDKILGSPTSDGDKCWTTFSDSASISPSKHVSLTLVRSGCTLRLLTVVKAPTSRLVGLNPKLPLVRTRARGLNTLRH